MFSYSPGGTYHLQNIFANRVHFWAFVGRIKKPRFFGCEGIRAGMYSTGIFLTSIVVKIESSDEPSLRNQLNVFETIKRVN